ncbi:MAG: AAA family ATPase, partial [Pseudomonadota bacterium]
MRIPNFSITNQRSIRLAACENAPRVMIITGPNGSGKSTLLNGLRQAQGGVGPILYVGPHRASRRQQVRARFLFQNKIKMSQMISQPSLPSYEGINIPNRNRDAWDSDESSNFLKYGLCQIELDRQAALAERFDANNEIQKDSLPDIWAPLKSMTEHLLPHLHFHKIDVTNRDQIRCLWKVHTKDIIVDIDDLSSGEKSIIQLFYPLIENRIQSLIDEIKETQINVAEENVCILMDEPELHLHPVLQGKILDYIRTISIRENVQFILATHSPTLVEHANSEELFLLRPTELVDGDHNQLIRVASDDEKLEVIREVFGSTSNVTAMRPLLVVEGRKSDKTSKRSSDSRVYSFLSDDFNRVTIIPGGGKSECKKLTASLNDLSSEFSEKLKAYALLDRDLAEGDPEEDFSIYLPVSMIENLLVDPEVIWNALTTVAHKTELTSVD